MNNAGTPPLIIAHRGASAIAPENTISAISRAIEIGSDGVEFDVRLAADGVPVVFHDLKLKRITGLKGRIYEHTSAELAKVDAGSWFNRSYPDLANAAFGQDRITSLEKTLGQLEHFDGVIYVELKCRENETTTMAKAVTKIVNASPLRHRIIIKSFKLQIIPLIKMLSPEVRTAALFAPKIMTVFRKEKHLVKAAAELGVDELSIHYSLATRKLIEKANKYDLPIAIWTADNPRWLKRAIKYDIKAVITNNPSLMINEMKKLAG